MSVARIQLRRDTASNWSGTNPILNAGEIGYETDTGKAKIGDGTAAWSTLAYRIYTPAFSDLTSTPTTIAGYGITDAFDGAYASLTGKPTLFDGAFTSLTGKPTTIGGYGITDAFNGAYASLTGKPTLFDGAFTSLTGKPTTIAGYGITDAFNSQFSSLQGLPNTIAGYGISDAFTGNFTDLTNVPTTVAGYGITDALTSVAFADLTSKPTTLSGYGITDAAPLASPSLTGAPTAPTASSGSNTTQLATTAFVQSAITPFAETEASGKLYFQDNAPTILALGELWLETDTGGFYKAAAGSTTIPLNNGNVASSSNTITVPAAGASDTRLVVATGLPSGSVTLRVAVHFESFTSTGVNQPEIGQVTYEDNTTANINSNSFTRSSGNAFDIKKIKSFTFTSGGTNNSSVSHITLTVSSAPEWQVKESNVQAKVDAIIDSAPGALNTLNELAAAINDDASFSTTITNSIATKAPLASPTLTGAPTAPTASTNTNTTQIATTGFVQQEITNKTINLSDLSVTQNAASGTGTLNYNNSSGVFSYTPPAGLTSIGFAAVTGKPTTISGYGITDALTTGANADIGSNNFITTGKVLFANMYANLSDLPSATTYHGMFAHVHATGAAYFAHAGNWVELTNKSDTNVVSISDSAPSSPASGDLWFDSTNLNLYVYYADGSSNQWVQTNPTGGGGGGSGSGISSVVVDTTPQLGGDLDVNGNSIVSVSNGNIPITPNGSGKVILDGLSWPTSDGTANQVIKTDGSGNLSFVNQSGGGGGSYANSDVDTHLNQSTAGTNEVLSWDGSDYAWVSNSGGGGGSYANSDVDTHLNKSTAATGEVLSWNGSDYDWVAQEFIKSYRYDGSLSTNTGTKRLYLQKGYTLKSIHAYVDTASAGAAVNTQIKKNGSNLQAVSIAAGATTASSTSLSHSIAANDYLTIDITQVGSSTAGENLYLVFTFN